ncbi:unnamed protein product [Rhodiola kirilowii]
MFVRKLVEKASLKKPGGQLDGLKPEGLNPRTAFHYGIPEGSIKLAYDSLQNILAVSTRNGQIKLFGHRNTQFLLESEETVSSKFLQFIENRGILLNVTDINHVEVWDIDGKFLSHVQVLKEEITSFTVLQHTFYMYVGDSSGNISVLKLDPEACCLVQMKYSIPFSASRVGHPTEDGSAVVHILQQPLSESKRILVVFKDGLATLWDVQESKAIFSIGKSPLQSSKETKEVTSACWVCPFGSKVVFGYSNGELSIWEIPSSSSIGQKTMATKKSFTVQTVPICKLNLGYKIDKNPIASLKWSYGEGNISKLYIIGASDASSSSPPQVLLLNENTESRMTKLGLHLPEACIDMEIISSRTEQKKPRQEYLLLLGKSGHIYVYDNYVVEKYLIQSQSKSPPSLPREIVLKLQFGDSAITAAKIVTNKQCFPSSTDEALKSLARNNAHFLPFETSIKDGTHFPSTHFDGFAKVQNLYITGHSNGVINFWDLTCPILIPLVSLKQQTEDISGNDIAVTALYYDGKSGLLVSGDQSGTINIFKFKPEPFSTESNFLSLQGNTKKGGSHIVQSIKFYKVTGAVICISKCQISKKFAIGSDKGYVSVIDIDGPTLIYEKHIPSEISAGIISLQFERCNLHGFEKNVLVVATKDSSVLAVDIDSGNELCANPIHPNKPSKALFMRILDGHETNESKSNVDGGFVKEDALENGELKQLSVLFCSEKAVYIYSLTHILQGIKKVNYKKKFSSSLCCWASTFSCSTSEGLILLYTSGKMEIRSLPNLSLLKETYIRGFTVPTPEPNISTSGSICSSREGEIVVLRGNQGIHFLSILHDTQTYRCLDSISHVYHVPQNPVVDAAIQKEKKKGIFSSVLKDFTGSKATHVPKSEVEDLAETLAKLEKIFGTSSFQSDSENPEAADVDEDEPEINIDDIDLDDILEKPKTHNKVAGLNTEKLASKFQVFKGKLKSMKAKNEKNPTKEEPHDEKNGAIDQIKKKYGFPSSTESSTGAARMAQSKLSENLRKLQGINQKTTDMNDTARSFSSMAKEVLRAEQGKQ